MREERTMRDRKSTCLCESRMALFTFCDSVCVSCFGKDLLFFWVKKENLRGNVQNARFMPRRAWPNNEETLFAEPHVKFWNYIGKKQAEFVLRLAFVLGENCLRNHGLIGFLEFKPKKS